MDLSNPKDDLTFSLVALVLFVSTPVLSLRERGGRERERERESCDAANDVLLRPSGTGLLFRVEINPENSRSGSCMSKKLNCPK